ncbi:MAG: prolyl oligopeptidase family serine peptidase [Acidobacteriota bacterium]
MSRVILMLALVFAVTAPASAESVCAPDAVQASGSIYRICMPAAADYNGMLVVWAHGFQDAGTPVSIPEEQLCFAGVCLPELINGLGFAFATNSYSKTGLAVLQGQNDILDLVNIFATQRGQPQKVYLVGASEGGIITALNVEQHPDVFSAGVAACGPVGDFQYQINYFGDARATFQVFFPGVIPGDAFNPDPQLTAVWSQYYDLIVKPIVMSPANRNRLNGWVAAAKLPYDPADYLTTVEISVRDVLRYSVVNLNDASATLGGFPFDNHARVYAGSGNDALLNALVPRAVASPAAIAEMGTHYATTGVLQRPLITLHTRRDQQVPYGHELLYQFKTLASGALFTRHLNLPVDRYEHCNFNVNEVLFSFAMMLAYDGALDQSRLSPSLKSDVRAELARRMRTAGMSLSSWDAAGTLHIQK